MKAANDLLAPYAVMHGQSERMYPEDADVTRFPFQRDRDRIIHAQAFRRLQNKTQVFIAGEGDHYRTRLTHTMEVAQISRDAARTLRLNEDLAEAIALAHDLGHPPFGHAGEEALDTWMKQHGGHFEHNEQSQRVVTLLEDHSALYPGLNLTREVLDGLRKHQTIFDQPHLRFAHAPTLEAQVVNIADEIAYTGHDIDDGLAAGLFSISDLEQMPLAKQSIELTKKRGTSLRGAIIHTLLTDLYASTGDTLRRHHIKNFCDVEKATMKIITFSEEIEAPLAELRSFLRQRMYFNPEVRAKAVEGQRIITRLCDMLLASPPPKVLALQEKCSRAKPTGRQALHEAVKDYVAGMTDRFATTFIHS
jgi:dGTPase